MPPIASSTVTTERRRRRHHIVPRFFLERFADQAGRLRGVDFHREASFITSPKEAAVETDFYTVEVQGSPSDAAERALAEVEHMVAHAFRTIGDGEWPMSLETRTGVANFLALQMVRGRRFREDVERMSEQNFRAFMRAEGNRPASIRQAYRAVEGHYPTDQEVAELAEMMRESRFNLTYPTGFSVNAMFKEGASLVQPASDLVWQLIECRERRFLTSDTPVTFWSDPKWLVVGEFRAPPEIEVTLAIDPYRCLFGRLWSTRGEIRREATDGMIEDLNRRTVQFAHRFVYGHLDSIGRETPASDQAAAQSG